VALPFQNKSPTARLDW